MLMVETVLSGDERRLRFPAGMAGMLVMLALALTASVMVALIMQGQKPGSLLAVATALPMGFLLWQARKDILNNVSKRTCAGLIIACLASMAYAPGHLNIALSWVLLVTGAVILRGDTVVDPLQIVGASIRHCIGGIGRAIWDGLFVAAALLYLPTRSMPRATMILLPAVAGLVFAALLVAANPLVAMGLGSLDLTSIGMMLGDMFNAATSPTALWFMFVFALLWPALRGRAVARAWTRDETIPAWHQTFFQPVTVISTLVMLNLMFAAQNLMDISYLWSDAKLPVGFSHAEYVHRGSYTLIVTALLAAALMMFILRKGSATEQSPTVRGLVYLWTGQNMLLVTSSVKRTLSYIDSYGWTEWRVSGLIWMALVFFGLAMIIVRILRNHDTRWLININLIASMVVLLVVSAWNMQGFIAERNVDRLVEFPHRMLDGDYLESLGPAVLPAFHRARQNAMLQQSGYTQGYFLYPAFHINRLQSELAIQQSDWRSWTLANALMTLPPDADPAMNRE
jgi:hypothetical protein